MELAGTFAPSLEIAATFWHEGKLFLEHLTGVSNDALHLLAGVGLWLVLAIVSRRAISTTPPLIGLLLVILWNESVDLWLEQWPGRSQQYAEGAKDIALTMLIPLAFMLTVRFGSRPERRNEG